MFSLGIFHTMKSMVMNVMIITVRTIVFEKRGWFDLVQEKIWFGLDFFYKYESNQLDVNLS